MIQEKLQQIRMYNFNFFLFNIIFTQPILYFILPYLIQSMGYIGIWCIYGRMISHFSIFPNKYYYVQLYLRILHFFLSSNNSNICVFSFPLVFYVIVVWQRSKNERKVCGKEAQKGVIFDVIYCHLFYKFFCLMCLCYIFLFFTFCWIRKLEKIRQQKAENNKNFLFYQNIRKFFSLQMDKLFVFIKCLE